VNRWHVSLPPEPLALKQSMYRVINIYEVRYLGGRNADTDKIMNQIIRINFGIKSPKKKMQTPKCLNVYSK
jgi:hypothetical protein